MSTDVLQRPTPKEAGETIFRLSRQGIQTGKLWEFGQALAVLMLYTGITAVEIRRLCDEGFDESKYHAVDGIQAPIKKMEEGAPPDDIVRHWLAYWSLFVVLCDEGSTASSGLPWLDMCMVGPCVKEGLILLPDGFRPAA